MIDNQEIISTIKQKINESHPGLVDDVILFGSRVTGTPKVDSDYNVLIITNKKINWRTKDAIIDICYDISLELRYFDRFKNHFKV